MQIRRYIRTTTPENSFEKNLEEELLSYSLNLSTLLNGGLRFSDNFNQTTVAVADTGSADTEFIVTHSLKRIPTGFLVIKKNKAGDAYESSTATETTLSLKFSAANAAITVMVF